MEKFLLGMITLYFLINVIILLITVFVDWHHRNKWTFTRLIPILLIGIIIVILAVFEDL